MKIPYGIHDYKCIKDNKYLFVDKTKYIEKIEDIGRFLVFLRPRRFGKTLFTSMLYYYYDVNSSHMFDHLYGDTYISKNKTPEVNSYYVLRFDFSGIMTEREVIKEQFADCVSAYLQEFIYKYKLDIEINRSIKDANTVLRDFLIKFKGRSDKLIYLIIDEYDHFANDVLSTDRELFIEMLSKDGFVRRFYEVFKTYSGTVIGRIFITGVTPITLDSLTSGFNNARNVARHELLNEMTGFSEEEVAGILDGYGFSRSHLEILRENYNGYLFTEEFSDSKVYNSNMVLYYLDSLVQLNRPPRNLVDSNVVSDYGKVAGMFDLYHNRDDKKAIIEDILKDIPIEATISDKFDLKTGFDKNHFLSLLYYLGMLTITKGSIGTITNLKVPNYVTKAVYSKYYFYYLNDLLGVRLDISRVEIAVNELSVNNNIAPFIKIIENVLNNLSNRDSMEFDEKHLKMVIVSYLMLSTAFLVKSEYEAERKYVDVCLLPNNVYESNNYFIFEIKYIKKGDYNESLLKEKMREATEQITGYGNSEEFKSIKNLRKYVLVFTGTECKVTEEVI